MPKDGVKKLFFMYFLPYKAPDHLSDPEKVALAKLHIENFCEFPADLVELSMRHVTWRFKWGIPKPADYRGCIEGEWKKRSSAYHGLKNYIEHYEKVEKPKIEADKKLQTDLAKERAERDGRIQKAVSAHKKKHGREPTKEELAAIEKADFDFIVYGKEPEKSAEAGTDNGR